MSEMAQQIDKARLRLVILDRQIEGELPAGNERGSGRVLIAEGSADPPMDVCQPLRRPALSAILVGPAVSVAELVGSGVLCRASGAECSS
jgi:hypothetical protein